MKRFVLFLGVLVVLLGMAVRVQTAPVGSGDVWEPADVSFAADEVGVPAVTVDPTRIPQAPPELGIPRALPINPREIDKESLANISFSPTFIPQHRFSMDTAENRSPKTGLLPESASLPLAPAKIKSFTGLPQSAFTPPDPTIAAGPSSIMVAVNSTVAIYTKTGTLRAQFRLGSFFAPLPEDKNLLLFDPRLTYDEYTNHFIFVVDALSNTLNKSWYFLAVSKTSDPMGAWAQWALDMGKNGKVSTNNWADFPTVGFDQKGIYLGGNMFNFVTNNSVYAKLRVLDKNKVLAFGNLPYFDFFNLKDATGQVAFTVQPVASYGTIDREFLLSCSDEFGSKVTLWSLLNPAAPHPLLQKRGIAVSSFKFPPDAPQKGGKVPIDTSDAGFRDNAVFSNGSIYAAHPIGYDFGSGEVSAIRFYQFHPDGTVVQEITFGADKISSFYPALTVDSRGNVIMVFSRTATTEFTSIRYTGRRVSDQLGTLQPSAILRSSTVNYVLTDDQGRNRWGDYNSASLDTDNSVWIYSEVAASESRWVSQVGRLRYP